MTSSHLIDTEQLLADQLAQASPDLLRGLLSTFIAALMGAEADALCGAGYRERSDERSNQRNGYRHRDFDTPPLSGVSRLLLRARVPVSFSSCLGAPFAARVVGCDAEPERGWWDAYSVRAVRLC